MSVPPSSSVTVPFTVNQWPADASAKLPTDGPAGAVLETVTLAEMFVAMDAVHVVAVAFSEQAMLSPRMAPTRESTSVWLVWLERSEPFMYQLQARAEAFSLSESGSVKLPGLQVAVELVSSGEDTVGFER